jgi:hypothetical protein
MMSQQEAVNQALRDVWSAIRNAAEPGTVVHDVRHGSPPTVLPGRTRETPELREARSRLDAAVRAFGAALVAESITKEKPA